MQNYKGEKIDYTVSKFDNIFLRKGFAYILNKKIFNRSTLYD